MCLVCRLITSTTTLLCQQILGECKSSQEYWSKCVVLKRRLSLCVGDEYLSFSGVVRIATSLWSFLEAFCIRLCEQSSQSHQQHPATFIWFLFIIFIHVCAAEKNIIYRVPWPAACLWSIWDSCMGLCDKSSSQSHQQHRAAFIWLLTILNSVWAWRT